MALSFIAGVAACSLLLFGVRLVLPVHADVAQTGGTNNTTGGLAGLLPDFETIYQQSLSLPFQIAESKIYDQDIAEYYRALMDRTGLAPRPEPQ